MITTATIGGGTGVYRPVLDDWVRGLDHFELSERERLNLHSTSVPRPVSLEKKTNTPPLTATTRMTSL